MKYFLSFGCIFLFGCNLYSQDMHNNNYQHTLPNVQIQRSVYDYPEAFEMNYLKQDCRESPSNLLNKI